MNRRTKLLITFAIVVWIGMIVYSVFNPALSYKVVYLDNNVTTGVAEVVYYVDDNRALADIPTSVQPLVRTIDGEPISSKPVGPWWNSPEIAGRNDDPGPGPWAGLDNSEIVGLNDNTGSGPVWKSSSKGYSSYEEYRELINSLKEE